METAKLNSDVTSGIPKVLNFVSANISWFTVCVFTCESLIVKLTGTTSIPQLSGAEWLGLGGQTLHNQN